MRAIPEDFRARLESGVGTFAHAWRVARRDGVVYGFTDHDGDVAFGGVTYRAATGVSAGFMETGLGLAADSAGAEGVLSADAIAEADIAAGLWDGARVDVWRVDWSAPALRVHVFAGRLGEVRRGASGFSAELRGLQAACDAPFGRVYSRFCDADVGDTRCGVDLGLPAFAGAGSVAAVTGPRSFAVDGLDAFADGWFTRGLLRLAGGVRREIVAHRVAGAQVTLEIDAAAPEAGAAFTVAAGCDKRFATCREKFANGVNFRGFPHMPGADVVAAGVDADHPLDGGSRLAR